MRFRTRLPFVLAALGCFLLLIPPATAGDEIEVEGAIEALGEASLTVGGYTFAVTGETEIEDDDGDLAFADLELGMFVEIEGFYTDSGMLVAEEVEVQGAGDDGDDIEVAGLITALADDGLTVGGLFFYVTAATEIEGESGDLTFDDLAVGMAAEVEGHTTAAGLLVADEIEVEGFEDQEVEVEGPIEALTDVSLTVGGYTFLVTDATEVDGDDGVTTFADFEVGMLVEVEGFYTPDGALVAAEIDVEDFDDDEVEVEGPIAELGDASLTVLGLTFAVTDDTLIRDENEQPITFADLAVGLFVEVRGVSVDGTLVATRIDIDDEFDDDEVELKAALDAVGDEMIVLLARPFLVLPTTPIRGLDDQPITLADLAAGQVVEVDARREADGSLVALRIERDDNPPEQIRLEAAVTAVGTATLDVLEITFVVDDATVIEGDDGQPITLADLAVGQRVEVDAIAEASGVRRATRIEVEDGGAAGGRVATPTNGSFALPGLQVTYGGDVLFVDEAGVPFDPAALEAGQAVRVSGAPSGPATLAASRVVVFGTQSTTANEGGVPARGFELAAVYPNPFAARATVQYTLDASAPVALAIVDVLGREVRRVEEGTRAAGSHTVALDATGLPNGVYFVILDVEGAGRSAQKIVLTR